MIDVRGLQSGAYVPLLVRQILNGRPVMVFFFSFVQMNLKLEAKFDQFSSVTV